MLCTVTTIENQKYKALVQLLKLTKKFFLLNLQFGSSLAQVWGVTEMLEMSYATEYLTDLYKMTKLLQNIVQDWNFPDKNE